MKLYLLFFILLSSFYNLYSFNFHYFKFNSIIKKPLEDSIINFIKIHNVNYIKIRNNTKYLVLKYYHEPVEIKKEEKKMVYNINTNNIIIRDVDDKKILNFINDKNYHNYLTLDDNDNEFDEDLYSLMPNMEEEIENNNLKIYDLLKNNKKPLIIIYSKSNIYKYSYLIKNRTSYISKYILNYNKKNYKYSFIINANNTSKFETNWTIDAKFNYRNESFINMTRNYIKDWIFYNINGNIKNYFYKKYLLSNYYD